MSNIQLPEYSTKVFAEETETMTRRRWFASATRLLLATAFFQLAGCSSSTDAAKSNMTDGKQLKVAGEQSPPSEKAVASIATAHGELVQPRQALLLQLRRDPWQALAAACLTPAFYNSHYAVPLVLDDGAEKREVAIAHDTASVSGFGPTQPQLRPRSQRRIGRRPLACLSWRPMSKLLDRSQRGGRLGADPRTT